MAIISNFIINIGGKGTILISQLGSYTIFTYRSILNIFKFPMKIRFILKEIQIIGAQSLSIVILTGFFTGMVLGLQGYETLKNVGSTGILGMGVAASLLAELGPVFTAILLTGRAGSAMSAQVGIMRSSEQIDALDCIGVDIFHYLISPKMAAGIFSLPILNFIFIVLGILGGYITGSVLLGVPAGIYVQGMQSVVTAELIRNSTIKSIFFAVLIISISTFQGYMVHTREEKGALGVSKATTSSVVISSVVILLFDYLVTSVLINM